MIGFQKIYFVACFKDIKNGGLGHKRKGVCMTRYVRSAQVTLEVTGTGCYRGKGEWGVEKAVLRRKNL